VLLDNNLSEAFSVKCDVITWVLDLAEKADLIFFGAGSISLPADSLNGVNIKETKDKTAMKVVNIRYINELLIKILQLKKTKTFILKIISNNKYKITELLAIKSKIFLRIWLLKG